MSRSWRTTLLVGCGSLLALGACNEMLGIEPAVIDPRLSALGNGAQAGTGGSSGGADAFAGNGAAPSGTGGDTSQAGSAHVHGMSGSAGSPASNGGEAGDDFGSGGTPVVSGGTHGHSDPGSAGEGGGAGDDSGPSDPCEEYCDVMDTTCTGEAAQYRDRDQCLKICRLLPTGIEDGPDEHGASCRLKYAKKTRYGIGKEVTNYCRQAGPSSAGKCGGVCNGFCALMSHVCTDETAPDYHFASDEECLATCNALPPAPVEYSSSDPLVSDGNHALCRIFHVTSAAMADADEHCEHAMGVTLCQATSP